MIINQNVDWSSQGCKRPILEEKIQVKVQEYVELCPDNLWTLSLKTFQLKMGRMKAQAQMVMDQVIAPVGTVVMIEINEII